MRFWDTSAVTALLVDEIARERMLALLQQDPQILVWWGVQVEIFSALSRREREKVLTTQQVGHALDTAHQLAAEWDEVLPTEAVRRTAERMLRLHPLRAADGLQLAAALIAANHDPSTLEFVCLDTRLSGAARREGFAVID